jgi:tRNA(Arg) A34 adenosine deaminase TadA
MEFEDIGLGQLDEKFIRKVYSIALESAESGFGPFGAILVKEGKIVSSSVDKCIQYSDPTSHAELALISDFCRKSQRISLEGYALYCNVEPCVMCSGAIHWSRISKVVFGVSQAILQSVSRGNVKPGCRELINIGNEGIEIIGPVLEEEGLEVLKKFPFKSKKRAHEAYHKKKGNHRL